MILLSCLCNKTYSTAKYGWLVCESNNNNIILLPQGQPGPLILDDDFLRVASTGITIEEEDDSNGVIMQLDNIPITS